ncbi:MAG: hypothetical protein HRT47_11750 [Candidatus Caenarcaniphilales bacterium]|nr:hypothetical protein [Candidatus Caenarcaniphilales bacterium]
MSNFSVGLNPNALSEDVKSLRLQESKPRPLEAQQSYARSVFNKLSNVKLLNSPELSTLNPISNLDANLQQSLEYQENLWTELINSEYKDLSQKIFDAHIDSNSTKTIELTDNDKYKQKYQVKKKKNGSIEVYQQEAFNNKKKLLRGDSASKIVDKIKTTVFLRTMNSKFKELNNPEGFETYNSLYKELAEREQAGTIESSDIELKNSISNAYEEIQSNNFFDTIPTLASIASLNRSENNQVPVSYTAIKLLGMLDRESGSPTLLDSEGRVNKEGLQELSFKIPVIRTDGRGKLFRNLHSQTARRGSKSKTSIPRRFTLIAHLGDVDTKTPPSKDTKRQHYTVGEVPVTILSPDQIKNKDFLGKLESFEGKSSATVIEDGEELHVEASQLPEGDILEVLLDRPTEGFDSELKQKVLSQIEVLKKKKYEAKANATVQTLLNKMQETIADDSFTYNNEEKESITKIINLLSKLASREQESFNKIQKMLEGVSIDEPKPKKPDEKVTLNLEPVTIDISTDFLSQLKPLKNKLNGFLNSKVDPETNEINILKFSLDELDDLYDKYTEEKLIKIPGSDQELTIQEFGNELNKNMDKILAGDSVFVPYKAETLQLLNTLNPIAETMKSLGKALSMRARQLKAQGETAQQKLDNLTIKNLKLEPKIIEDDHFALLNNLFQKNNSELSDDRSIKEFIPFIGKDISDIMKNFGIETVGDILSTDFNYDAANKYLETIIDSNPAGYLKPLSQDNSMEYLHTSVGKLAYIHKTINELVNGGDKQDFLDTISSSNMAVPNQRFRKLNLAFSTHSANMLARFGVMDANQVNKLNPTSIELLEKLLPAEEDVTKQLNTLDESLGLGGFKEDKSINDYLAGLEISSDDRAILKSNIDGVIDKLLNLTLQKSFASKSAKAEELDAKQILGNKLYGKVMDSLNFLQLSASAQMQLGYKKNEIRQDLGKSINEFTFAPIGVALTSVE